ncbi:MAG: PilZ domain-containing protein [Planctomycetota bacterium]|jgi:hypothetical protein
MLASDTKVFLNIPRGSRMHLLHPALIKDAGKRGYTAELDEADVLLGPGQELFVYYYLRHKFVKQAARVDAVMQNEPTLVVGFQTTGEPMPAETRESFRVSTVMADLTATVGAEDECRLLDVSNTGFAVEATQRYELGQVVSVTLRYQGRQFSGKARVQSIRELDLGKVRYGLHAVEDRASGGDVRKGQQHISAAVEREQLRRLSRSG